MNTFAHWKIEPSFFTEDWTRRNRARKDFPVKGVTSVFGRHIKSVAGSQRSNGVILGPFVDHTNLTRHASLGLDASVHSQAILQNRSDRSNITSDKRHLSSVHRTLRIYQIILRLHHIHLGIFMSYPKTNLRRNSPLGDGTAPVIPEVVDTLIFGRRFILYIACKAGQENPLQFHSYRERRGVHLSGAG